MYGSQHMSIFDCGAQSFFVDNPINRYNIAALLQCAGHSNR